MKRLNLFLMSVSLTINNIFSRFKCCAGIKFTDGAIQSLAKIGAWISKVAHYPTAEYIRCNSNQKSVMISLAP